MTENNFLSLCRKIEDDCKWNAEIHHQIASSASRLSFWFQIIPAICVAIFAILVSQNLWLNVTVWLTLISGIITAIANIMNPKENYYQHLSAGKTFTILKQRAYALYTTFATDMSQESLSAEVKQLQEAYNIAVLNVPPTNNKAFDKATKRIKKSVHEPEDHS